MASKAQKEKPWSEYATTTFWVFVSAASWYWWRYVGNGSRERFLMVVSLSLAAFVVGCTVGFLFTSYGEEASTVGKVRDWLIAGISGVTLSQIFDQGTAFKRLLVAFAAGPGPNEYALVVAIAVVYSGAGFFFMFFQRELIFNIVLAKSRAERGKLEGSQVTGQIVQRFQLRLPASVLTGVDDIDENPDMKEQEVRELRDQLYSDDVDAFLKQADDAVKVGSVDWDVSSKAAYIYYYRMFLAKGDQQAEVEKALEWIMRALHMNPLHVDLTMKYAAALGARGDFLAAAAELERLLPRADAPILVKQWLGYYLRFLPDRLDDAIRYCHEFHAVFPDESDTYFNEAYAYAEKYCAELHASGAKANPESQNRLSALSKLRDALRDQSDMKETVRDKWTEAGEGFDCLLHDREFRSIVGLPEESSAA